MISLQTKGTLWNQAPQAMQQARFSGKTTPKQPAPKESPPRYTNMDCLKESAKAGAFNSLVFTGIAALEALCFGVGSVLVFPIMAATGFVLSIVGGFSGKAEKEKMLQRQWEHKQKLASLPKTPETPEPPPHIQKAIAQEVMDKVRQAGEPTRPIQKAQPLTPNPPTEAVEPVVKSPTSTVTTAKDSTKASATEPPPTPAAITPHNLTPQQVLENWSNSQLSLLLVDRQNYTEEQRLEWLKGRLEHFGIPYCAEFDTGLKRRDKQ